MHGSHFISMIISYHCLVYVYETLKILCTQYKQNLIDYSVHWSPKVRNLQLYKVDRSADANICPKNAIQ